MVHFNAKGISRRSTQLRHKQQNIISAQHMCQTYPRGEMGYEKNPRTVDKISKVSVETAIVRCLGVCLKSVVTHNLLFAVSGCPIKPRAFIIVKVCITIPLRNVTSRSTSLSTPAIEYNFLVSLWFFESVFLFECDWIQMERFCYDG